MKKSLNSRKRFTDEVNVISWQDLKIFNINTLKDLPGKGSMTK
jgi:hypothetical protein